MTLTVSALSVLLGVGSAGCSGSPTGLDSCRNDLDCPASQLCRDQVCIDLPPAPDATPLPDGAPPAADGAPTAPDYPAPPETWSCTSCESDTDCMDGAGCYDVPGGAKACLWQGCNSGFEFGEDRCPSGYACGEIEREGSPQVCLPQEACCDLDGDSHGLGQACLDRDCDERNPEIHPGMTESCDGLDQNCNGEVDEESIEAGIECETESVCMTGGTVCIDGEVACEDSSPLPALTPCGESRLCGETGECVYSANCQELHRAFPRAENGIYSVTLDGAYPDGYDVYCDFSTAGGSWTLCHNSRCTSLPSNAGMPRCGETTQTRCYAGKYADTNIYAVDVAGRGVWWVGSDGTSVQRLERNLTWNAIGRHGIENRGACSESRYCGGPDGTANSRCLFSTMRDGTCCTNPNQRNFCL